MAIIHIIFLLYWAYVLYRGFKNLMEVEFKQKNMAITTAAITFALMVSAVFSYISFMVIWIAGWAKHFMPYIREDYKVVKGLLT